VDLATMAGGASARVAGRLWSAVATMGHAVVRVAKKGALIGGTWTTVEWGSGTWISAWDGEREGADRWDPMV
jgi:hypothetical protein